MLNYNMELAIAFASKAKNWEVYKSCGLGWEGLYTKSTFTAAPPVIPLTFDLFLQARKTCSSVLTLLRSLAGYFATMSVPFLN